MNLKRALIATGVILFTILGMIAIFVFSENSIPESTIEPTVFSSETLALLADVADDELILAFSSTEPFIREQGETYVYLLASNPNAIIYYTLDGSAPTVESNVYYSPLQLGSFSVPAYGRAIVLRAMAVYGDKVSEAITQTYFFAPRLDTRFDTLIFSISTNPDYLFCHYNGIFVPGILREEFIRDNPGHYVTPPDPANFNLRGREAERPAYIEVFSPDGERVFSQAAGVRTHGGWSRAQEQKSIRIIARQEYSPGYGQFHFDFFPWEVAHDGSPITRYDTLILRNGGNDRYHGIFRHELGSILARNAGFTAVSPARPAAVFVNGEYYGFAWLQVRFNAQYIQHLFNTPTRNIDIVGMGEWWHDTDDMRIINDLDHKNSFAHKNLLDDDIFAEFESLVDIDNMLFYYAFQIFMGNEDWPHNNMRRWRYTGPELGLTPETDGRWRYILFDLDWTLGLYGDNYTKPTFYRVLVRDDPRSPLLINVLSRPDMQERFTNIMQHISDNVVNEQTVTETLNYLFSASRNEVTHALSAGKYPYWFTMGFAEYNHRNMINFARYRYRQIFADMDAFFHEEDSQQEMQSSIPFDLATQYIHMLEAILNEDGGILWGMNLNAPFMFVDPVTRNAVANRPDLYGALTRQGEVYVGTLPDEQMIGHTAAYFNGQMWAMMLWSQVESTEDVTEVLRVMIHELFHVAQPELFGQPQGIRLTFNDYGMDTRILIRLEKNALLRALISDTEEYRFRAIHDALSIRAERRQRDFVTSEDIELEILEGLAVYTDLMLGLSYAAERITSLESFARSMSGSSDIRTMSTYAFGALYGFLLDKTDADWRHEVRFTTDLGGLLQDALGITELTPFNALDLEIYGYAEITANETVWAETLEQMIQATLDAFSDQPTLQIDVMGNFSGDFEVIFVWDLGDFPTVFYGDIVFSGVFGQLSINGGPLQLADDNYIISAAGLEINGERAFGYNWELELNDDFEIREISNGNFLVTRSLSS